MKTISKTLLFHTDKKMLTLKKENNEIGMSDDQIYRPCLLIILQGQLIIKRNKTTCPGNMDRGGKILFPRLVVIRIIIPGRAFLTIWKLAVIRIIIPGRAFLTIWIL